MSESPGTTPDVAPPAPTGGNGVGMPGFGLASPYQFGSLPSLMAIPAFSSEMIAMMGPTEASSAPSMEAAEGMTGQFDGFSTKAIESEVYGILTGAVGGLSAGEGLNVASEFGPSSFSQKDITSTDIFESAKEMMASGTKDYVPIGKSTFCNILCRDVIRNAGATWPEIGGRDYLANEVADPSTYLKCWPVTETHERGSLIATFNPGGPDHHGHLGFDAGPNPHDASVTDMISLNSRGEVTRYPGVKSMDGENYFIPAGRRAAPPDVGRGPVTFRTYDAACPDMTVFEQVTAIYQTFRGKLK